MARCNTIFFYLFSGSGVECEFLIGAFVLDEYWSRLVTTFIIFCFLGLSISYFTTVYEGETMYAK